MLKLKHLDGALRQENLQRRAAVRREVQSEADKLRDELDALKWERDRLHDALTAERASMAAARTELAALRKDAERYRWLKRNPSWLGLEQDFSHTDVERSIDATMAADK